MDLARSEQSNKIAPKDEQYVRRKVLPNASQDFPKELRTLGPAVIFKYVTPTSRALNRKLDGLSRISKWTKRPNDQKRRRNFQELATAQELEWTGMHDDPH